MKRKNTARNALVTSVISMLLCVSMLVGTTFAWFTDSVVSANNIIKSGNLDVAMMWADGKEDPATVTWTDASTGPIFDYDLWEPGYTVVRHVKISNEGSLALKYQLNMAANGEVSKLAEVIDVYYADPAQQILNRAALAGAQPMATLDQALKGMAQTAYGELKPGEAHTVTIALKMQETASNEYQNLSIGSDFSVILMATQLTYESDSFDNQYDDIEIPEMDIKTINGVTYGTTMDGNYVMISVDDYTLTTFAVDDAVTILGTGNGVNDNDRVFGKNAPLASLTLNEGLVEIKDNALNALPNLTTVNFPSTLKTIGIQAFRQTGMTALTIPENVETIKMGAFRDMANLTTVTVEGNVVFDNYAFRSCPNLTSIYLLGDDVTFTGKQFATHSDNGDATGITIYVKNSDVAARVYAAQESAYGYQVKILGAAADGSDAADVSTVKNADALQTALNSAADGDVIILGSNITGEVTATQKPDVKVEINGAGKTISKPIIVDGKSATYTTAGLTIKNVNFKADSITEDACINLGKEGDNNTRYTCNVTIENCTFDVPGAVGVKSYTGGDKNLVIRNCTATASAHSLAQLKGIDGVLIENCKVYSKNGINLNNSDNVTVDGCTVDVKGYAVRFGESSGGVGAAETYAIKNSTLKSANDDGDATIVLRGTADYATLTIVNTTIEGTPDITNTATGATVVK